MWHSVTSTLLNPIMFTNDANLFYSQKDSKFLSNTVSNELDHFKKWFSANKLNNEYP